MCVPVCLYMLRVWVVALGGRKRVEEDIGSAEAGVIGSGKRPCRPVHVGPGN